jgi:hypothetical protein
MEIKLSDAAMAEIELVQMLNDAEIPVPMMEKIYLAVRKFGDIRYEEGYDKGYYQGVLESMED